MKIRTLIVDDEAIARKRLRRFLLQHAGVEIVRECADGREAVAAIKDFAPDLLFLDIQMPELDGFGVLQTIGPKAMPVVIFVTAYDEFALQAFEAQAIDYLLKPFDQDRFGKAFQRAKTFLQGHGHHVSGLSALTDYLAHQPAKSSRLVIKCGERILFLRPEEIDWIEAVGNYVMLHVAQEKHLFRSTMSEMEARLPSSQFLRIHRSTLVNLDSVREVHPSFQGESVVLLKKGARLDASRSGTQKLLGLLRQAA